MPSEVALIISEAIRQGWKPKEQGALLSSNFLKTSLWPKLRGKVSCSALG